MTDQIPAFSIPAVLKNLPEPRLAPYLSAAEDDPARALELYEWNAKMSGAAIEQVSHLEVLLRHTVDQQLRLRAKENQIGIPWFLLPPMSANQQRAVDQVRDRLRGQRRETRDQVIAGLSFGFWSGWFGNKHEELWRQSLHAGFPNGSGHRKEVAKLAEQIRKFRNRVAHHDSLLNIDVGFEMEAVFRLAEIINSDVAAWMRSVDRTDEVGSQKPFVKIDTVVVPAAKAWSFYENAHAYVCQAGRFFQKVDYFAFYEDQEIKPEVPRIIRRYDNVIWNRSEAERLSDSERKNDKTLGRVMSLGLESHWPPGIYQVFLLSQQGMQGHVSLPHPVPNSKTGKGSAFVRKQRYTSIHQLRYANDVWDCS